MRQHAHPMRRAPRRRRRVGATVVAAVGVLLVAAALVWRPPTASSPVGLVGGPNAAVALEPTPSGSAAPSAGAAAAPTPSPAAIMNGTSAPSLSTSLGDAVADTLLIKPVLRPARLAMDAWPPPAPAPLWSLTGYVWPIAHPRLTLPFGPTPWGTRVVNGQLYHDGIDLATFCNDRIMAAHDGVVLAVGRHFDDLLGWVGSLAAYYKRLDVHHLWPELPIVVVIDDGNGYRSVYAHFWKTTVQVGQRVRAGQLIGYEGMTGHATGCHLHYSLFSPLETRTFGIEPKVAKDMRLPRLEIARVDPLLVLPYRKGLGGTRRNLGG
jgi:murein DD-endopeptidase MepM/ murein hydrolase activator NlpD